MRILIASLTLMLSVAPIAIAQEPTEAIAPRTSAAVQAILKSPRRTPADSARVLFVLIDLDEIELARPVLTELTGKNFDDATLAALVREFGSAKFLKLTATKELGPEAATFATEALAAANRTATDPQRLAQLVAQLGNESKSKQYAALADLKTTGTPGVLFLLNELAKQPEAKRQNQLRDALVALAPISTPLLLGVLDSTMDAENAEALKTQTAYALGQIESEPALPFLATMAVFQPADSVASRAAGWSHQQIADSPATTDSFARTTSAAIERYTTGGFPFTPDADGMITLGRWDAKAKQVVAVELPSHEASLVLAARLAEARAAMQGDRREVVRQALVLRLEADAVLKREGLSIDQESRDELLSLADGSQLNESLAAALKQNYSGAAVGLAATMAGRGDLGALATADGKPSSLADALVAAHPAVRFAALEAVMQLKPQTPFPGSSRVADALLFFATGDTRAAAVVATPNYERSATIGGLLSGANLSAQITNRGCEAVKLAARPDMTLVLVDLAVLDPPVRETVFRLRRQPATANVPIGLLASEGRLAEAQTIAAEHERMLAFSRPHSSEVVTAMATELQALLPSDWPTNADRATRAKQSRQWITTLLTDGPTFYGLREDSAELQAALARTTDPATAIDALTLLGTPASQVTLLDFVSQETLPIATRQQAAKAFDNSVKQHGVLLTSKQIVMQYDRYNASETASQATQEVLGAVLDTIEAKKIPTQQATN